MKRKNPNETFELELYLKVKVKDEDLISAIRKIRKLIKGIKDRDVTIEEIEVIEE